MNFQKCQKFFFKKGILKHIDNQYFTLLPAK